MKQTKILFICKERSSYYGISTGLLQSSKFIVDYLVSQGIDSKVVVCKDANAIDREVYNYRPTKVVIHAIWVTPAKIQELATKYSSVTWAIMVHSKLPFLSYEGNALKWLNEYTQLPVKNVCVGCNNAEGVVQLTIALREKLLYLPNIYSETLKVCRGKNDKRFFDIGCFGAIRPLKNMLIQADAAIGYAQQEHKRLRFHVNAERVEQSGEQCLKNIRALFEKYPEYTLVEHGWLTHEEFLRLIGTMDIGMQVSLSETFNITAADFVYMNVPIVVSPEIEWMPKCGQVDPTNVIDIIEKIGEVLVFQTDGLLFSDYAERALKRYNKKAQKIWMNFVD